MMVEETQGREPLWLPLMYDKEQKDELSTRDLGQLPHSETMTASDEQCRQTISA